MMEDMIKNKELQDFCKELLKITFKKVVEKLMEHKKKKNMKK